jgi:pimeloyl-ACP methyl ester carboxylesterase
MAIFVLIHGSWHGGWCWKRVAPLLRSYGHQVYTPTLTGLGERSHLLSKDITLETHVQDIANLLYYEDLLNVVLVGHSYAGMILSYLPNMVSHRLGTLVYLDGYLPSNGQCAADLWPPEEQIKAQLDMREGRELRSAPPASAFGIGDQDLSSWVNARLTPHPLRTYMQPAPSRASIECHVPCTYIHCTGGPTAVRFAQQAERARKLGWPVSTLSTGHDAMLTEPQELCKMLLRLLT